MDPEQITVESLPKLDIKALALDKEKFGALSFDSSCPLLENLREIFVELDELNFPKKLTHPEGEKINALRQEFLNLVKQLAAFDPAIDSNFSGTVRDNYNQNVTNFYNSNFPGLRGPLTYLRQQAPKELDTKKLQEAQKQAAKAKQDYDQLSKQLEAKLKSLEERKQQVEAKHGEIAAVTFGKHFESQAFEYDKASKIWLTRGMWAFGPLTLVITLNLIIYFFAPSLKYIFTVEYGVIKAGFLILLSYAVGFCSRQYSINSNLAAIEKHRKNVAETLIDFYSSIESEDVKAQVVQRGSDAMFKHLSSGYIKTPRDEGPVQQIISGIPIPKIHQD